MPWWDFFSKNDGSWIFFSFSQSVRRACMCVWTKPLVLSLEEKRERERGELGYLGRQGYTHLLSPLPITLLRFFPPFSGKNGWGMREEYRGVEANQKRGGAAPVVLLFLSFFSIRPRFHLSGFRVVIRHMYRLLLLLLPKKDWRHLVTIDNVRSAKSYFLLLLPFLNVFPSSFLFLFLT